MRKSVFTIMLSLAMAAAGAQTITVESDQLTDTDFSKYKTFYWTSQVDNELDEGVYFLNDLVLKAQVREAVKSEMTGLGYKMDKDDPDLLVNFRLFDKQVNIRSGQGYGDQYWGGQQVADIENSSYDLKPGTIIVSLADRETGRVVWHGFASGLINNNEFIKDEGKVREAINMIFDEYNRRAKEYTRK